MAEGVIDLTKLNKKIWLVKVPQNVASAWRPICEQAMNPTNLEEDVPTLQLGTVRVDVATDQEAAEKYKMTLITTGKNGPQAYKLNPLTQSNGSVMVAMSYKSEGQNDENGSSIRAEGTVDASFNATPSFISDDKVDQSYAALNKERSIKASIKSRTVRAYEDTRESNLSRLSAARASALDIKRRAEDQRRAREDNKRVRADVDVLERELFSLFERQSTWSMAKLVAETRQPAAHLKTVLEKIAVFNKRGPNRDTYQLKKDYLLGSSQAQEQQQTNDQGGS